MSGSPAAAIASWPAPNYVNPETRGPTNLIVLPLLLGIVTIVLAIRIYTRTRISNGFGLDDVLIVAAYVPAATFAVLGLDAEYRWGWNRHVWDVPLSQLAGGLKLSLVTVILFDIATNLTKLSMLALIYRLTTASQSRVRFLVMGLAVVISVDSMVFVLVTIFQCRPIAASWTLALMPTAQCIDHDAHLLAAGSINTVTDFLIVLLPIRTVLALKLPVKQRIIVYLLFTGGLLATAAGAVRTYVTFIMGKNSDPTWDGYLVVLASSVELYIGIIVASIPATKPFFSLYIPRLLGTSNWTTLKEPLQERKKTEKSGFSAFSFLSRSRNSSEELPLQEPPPSYATRANPGSHFSFDVTSPKTPSPRYSEMKQSLEVREPQFSLAPAPAPLRLKSPPPPAPTNLSNVDLNKPLPLLRKSTHLAPEDNAVVHREPSQQSRGESTYEFKVNADGHISVYKSTKSNNNNNNKHTKTLPYGFV